MKKATLKGMIAMEKIKKSFQEGTVIVYVTSVGYLPIMNVSIQSLISQCKAENHYDIVILDTNADQFDKKNVKMLAGEKKNISIRFFEPIAWVKKLISLEITLEAYTPYFRALLPWIMYEYDKILYLGADTIIKHDVAELYNKAFPEQKLVLSGPGHGDTSNEFDFDVMLMDAEGVRRQFQPKDIINVMLNEGMNECQTYAHLLQQYIHPLSAEWDTQPKRVIDINKMDEFRIKAKLIHYKGVQKPWTDPLMILMEDWWIVARCTAYYEEIVRRMCLYAPDNRSGIRIVMDEIFPKGSKRRAIVKSIIKPFV